MNKLKFSFILFSFICLMLLPLTVNAKADYNKFDINIKDGEISLASPYKTDSGDDVLSEDVSRGYVWNMFISNFKVLIVGFTGLASIALVGFALFGFTKLGAFANNPQKKSDAIMHLGVIFVAGMLLGTVSLVFGYAYNVFR